MEKDIKSKLIEFNKYVKHKSWELTVDKLFGENRWFLSDYNPNDFVYFPPKSKKDKRFFGKMIRRHRRNGKRYQK